MRLQHEKHIWHQQEALLLKKQLNSSKTLSAEYASLRKWNHDIENHLFSLSYLINAKNYSEADKYLESVLSPKATPSHTFEKTDSPAANFAANPPQNLLLSIPLLFISTFLFQLIYFLATLYPQETSLEFFILGVLLIFICIIFYQTLNDQLKKIQIASQFSMLQKQHQMEQEQMDHLHFRTEETYVLQRKTESALTHIQDLLSNHKYPEAAAALDSFSQTFQKERFHPYFQDNLIQAILEGKKLRAEQYHIQVSYEIFLPDKLSIEITDLCSVFFNLMDNAIEACLQSGSQKPFIRLSTEFSGECLSIYLHNTKNPEQIFNHQTTKKESYNPLPSHGFGLSIIEDICQKYDGAYQWLDRTDYFDSIVLLKFL
ncbi:MULTISPECIES: ATP-binding protein [unclassified Blautia]|uniref:ATP-binding protein n=1 Tax=unclassified Blautia TaxID=2648079 RepID=UPI003F8CD57E